MRIGDVIGELEKFKTIVGDSPLRMTVGKSGVVFCNDDSVGMRISEVIKELGKIKTNISDAPVSEDAFDKSGVWLSYADSDGGIRRYIKCPLEQEPVAT